MHIKKNVKALSPIFAVLILIAITVIAGIVVYMFTSGYLGTMMGGGTAGQEKVAIETVSGGNNTILVWAKSTGGGPVVITEFILRDAQGKTLEVGKVEVATGDLDAGILAKVECTTTDITLNLGDVYTVALVSKLGNQFVSPSFKAG